MGSVVGIGRSSRTFPPSERRVRLSPHDAQAIRFLRSVLLLCLSLAIGFLQRVRAFAARQQVHSSQTFGEGLLIGTLLAEEVGAFVVHSWTVLPLGRLVPFLSLAPFPPG